MAAGNSRRARVIAVLLALFVAAVVIRNFLVDARRVFGAEPRLGTKQIISDIQQAPPPAPRPTRLPTPPPPKFEQSKDDGAQQVKLAGAIISMGQKLALGEALAQNAANAEKYVEKFCEQSSKLPPLPQAGSKADAAAYLAPRMDYEQPLDQPPGSLHLPDELRARLRSPDWPAQVTDADLQRDFSWLTELQQFDHWSYLGAGRLRDYPITDAPHAPIPNYASLFGWAKLRYALAQQRGDTAAAVSVVRHLADLMRSQGILMAEATALAIYKLESQLQLPGAMDPLLLQQRKDLDFAAMYFSEPGVDPSVVRKAMACSSAPCTAMSEGLAINQTLRGASEANDDNAALLGQLAAGQGCEAELFTRLSAAHEYTTAQALSEMAEGLPNEIPRRLNPTKP